MNSCYYLSEITHERLEPKPNAFRYRLYFLYLDLSELEALEKKVIGFRYNRRGFFSFCDRDHFRFLRAEPGNAETIAREKLSYDRAKYEGKNTRERIGILLQEQGLDFELGRVMILTSLRTFGYYFNPVCFYFCFDKVGQFRAMFSEVNNTFHDQKMYLARIEDPSRKSFEIKETKNYYVSPFTSHDNVLRWRFTIPADRLAMAIDSLKGDKPELKTVLLGRQRELSPWSLWRLQFRHPFVTLMAIVLIHYQAAKLFIKKVPFGRKEASDQAIADRIRVANKK